MTGVKMNSLFCKSATILAIAIAASTLSHPPTQVQAKLDDKSAIAALDTEYQAAVAKNDAATMARLLADDFTLVTGSGKVYSKQDLLDEAMNGRLQYERQDDSEQTVRLWGNTAVITAKLYAKGTEGAKPFEYTLWFSDTYIRTPSGWRYVFGQSSIPLQRTGSK
jgi:uncharacterized protein (TIGR02246 family)